MATTFYKDIDFSFEATTTGDFLAIENLDSIKVSLYNILNINDNENFLAEGFGHNLRDLLLEPMDDITTLSIENLIESEAKLDERISETIDVVVTPNLDTMEYDISVKTFLNNIIDPQEIDLVLKKTR